MKIGPNRPYFVFFNLLLLPFPTDSHFSLYFYKSLIIGCLRNDFGGGWWVKNRKGLADLMKRC